MRGRFSPRALYLAFSAVSSLLFTMVFTISSLYYIETIGLTALQLVLVGTVLELVYFIFEVPTGVVADVYSRRLSIILGTLLTGVAFVLEGSVPHYMFVLTSQVLWGIGATFLSGATEAWIADFTDEEQLERTYMRAAQLSQLSALLGILLSVVLAMHSVRLPIVLSGVLFLFLALFLIGFMPESSFTPLIDDESSAWRKMTGTFASGLKAVKKSRVLSVLFLITLVSGLASEGFDRLWSAHFIENFTFPEVMNFSLVMWFGMINGIGLIVSIIFTQVLMRRLEESDESRSVSLLFILHIGQIFFLLIFASAGHFGLALTAYLSIYMMRMIHGPIHSALVIKNVHSSIRSTVISSEGQINSIGQIIGGPIVGWIALKASIASGVLSTGIILVPGVLLYLLLIKIYQIHRSSESILVRD